jgi:soluble lytic murein transglycosylase-like protein
VFVPARFREPILRSAARWNVSAGLIAAQLLVESNFNPNAVSPAGAQGIAQFMPGTAAAYGLRDPFDPGQAIDAQAT